MAELLSFKSVSEVAQAALPTQPYFIIVSADFEKMPSDEMHGFAQRLVTTNAIWVAAHGNQATLFDDAVDFAFVESEIAAGGELPTVMTTWHDGETLEEVASFLETVTPPKDWDVEHWPTIILRIGSRQN